MFESGIDTEQAFGHHVTMSRTRVRRRRTTLMVLAVALTTLLMGPVGHAFDAGAAVRHPRTMPRTVPRTAPRSVPRSVVVQPGDSLWAIARRTEPSVDPRATVDAIVAANGIGESALVPGQRLVVPAP
jgi:nucleoid-associated protein YgaU